LDKSRQGFFFTTVTIPAKHVEYPAKCVADIAIEEFNSAKYVFIPAKCVVGLAIEEFCPAKCVDKAAKRVICLAKCVANIAKCVFNLAKFGDSAAKSDLYTAMCLGWTTGAGRKKSNPGF
jgi:hypothetical protein